MNHPNQHRDHFFSQVLSKLPSLVSYIDCDLNYRYMNAAYGAWFGINPSDYEGASAVNLVGESAINTVKPFLDQAMLGHEQTFELKVPYRMGGSKYVKTNLVPDRDESGTVLGVIVIVHDVSELVEAKNRIQSSQEQLSKVVNGVPVLISYWDKNCRNIFANDLYTQYFCNTPSDMRGKHFAELLAPIYKFAKPNIDLVLTGVDCEFQSVLEDQNGIRRRFKVSYKPDWVDGQVEGFYVIAKDITDHYNMAFRLEQMAENVDEVFFLSIAATNQVVYISPAYERIWGRSCQSLYEDHRTFIESIHPEDRERVMKGFGMKGTEKQQQRYRIVLPNGAIRWIHGKSYPVQSPDGQIEYLTGTALDVTEQVEKELLYAEEKARALHASKLATLGEMSAGVAHEINNPLAIISGNLSLIERYVHQPEKLKSKLTSMERSVFRISKIVSGLRKFSRTSSEPHYLPERLSSIVSEFRPILDVSTRPLTIPIEIELQSESQILCDETEINQVLVNLVNNAMDAVKPLPEKWVKLKVYDEGDQVVLQIKDSGTGIPREVEEKIFQPFFTTKPIGEGTGLGLSISKGILDQHHAKLSLNRADQNTCFEVRFDRIS